MKDYIVENEIFREGTSYKAVFRFFKRSDLTKRYKISISSVVTLFRAYQAYRQQKETKKVVQQLNPPIGFTVGFPPHLYTYSEEWYYLADSNVLKAPDIPPSNFSPARDLPGIKS